VIAKAQVKTPKDMHMITQIQKAANSAVIKIDDGLIKSSIIKSIAPDFCIPIKLVK